MFDCEYSKRVVPTPCKNFPEAILSKVIIVISVEGHQFKSMVKMLEQQWSQSQRKL